MTDVIRDMRRTDPIRSKETETRIVEWEALPDGWKTQDPHILGWNVVSILEAQKAKWHEFLHYLQGTGPMGVSHEAPSPSSNDYSAHNTLMSYAYVLALAAHQKEQLSLLDWGGGLGHYFHISRALLPNVELDYHCMEVPLLCQGGRELNPDAEFHENDNECFSRRFDLVLASSSLQYVEDWREKLQQLAAATEGYLFVTRLPVIHSVPSFVVVQRPYQYGYDTEYMGWFLNRGELLQEANNGGMELVREFLIDERPNIQGAPEQGEYRGFLFRPRRLAEGRLA